MAIAVVTCKCARGVACARIPRVFRLASQNRKRPLSDSGPALKLPRMTATTSLRDTVFSVLAEYGGGAVARIAKVWATIRRVLGNVRQLVRPLLKELVAFFASKLTRGATVVRETSQKAGDALMRVVQRIKGKRYEAAQEEDQDDEKEPEREPTKPAKRVAETAQKQAAPEPCASPSAVAPESSRVAREAILAPREPNEPNGEALSTLGPVVGRALIRAFTRPRAARPVLSRESEVGFAPILRARAAAQASAKQAQAKAATAQH
ncbi:MAG: hypothetical protein U0441_20240 [Polyangiaceae bacterium]